MPLQPLRELMYRLQHKKFERSYESIKHTCKNETAHGFVKKEKYIENKGSDPRPMGDKSTKNRR
jgi:hypothetical protein